MDEVQLYRWVNLNSVELFSINRLFLNTDEPEILITMKDSDVKDVLLGKLDARRAFILGKVKIIGNISLAIKLLYLLKMFRPRFEEVFATMNHEVN